MAENILQDKYEYCTVENDYVAIETTNKSCFDHNALEIPSTSGGTCDFFLRRSIIKRQSYHYFDI